MTTTTRATTTTTTTTMNRFCRYELRTTDLDAARAFYADILGPDFWGGELSLSPLPAHTIALGARPHWLGHIGVKDIEATAGRFVAQGGQQRSAPGAPVAVMRDPFGAIMALGRDLTIPSRASVAWHVLHCTDHQRAFASYAALFGWTAKELVDQPPELDRHQVFAWDETARGVGSVANTARRPEIHPQWQFFFPVVDLESALAQVRARGGLALAPVRTFTGDLAAACDDPQGAAFGLLQAAPCRAPGVDGGRVLVNTRSP
ncbi:MAG: VOC family protein [Bacteroidota bacterium]